MKIITTFIIFFLFFLQLTAQTNNYHLNDKKLVLNNGIVKKIIDFSDNKVTSLNLFLSSGEESFIIKSPGFSFLLNGEELSGFSQWKLLSVESVSDSLEGSGVLINLENTDKYPGFKVSVKYLMYPNLPVIRKQLLFRNNSANLVALESVDSGVLEVGFGVTHTWILTNFARQKQFGPYKGNWNDPALIVHDVEKRRGLLLGNEAPGVMKRTTALLDGKTLTTGLTHRDEDFAFRRWLDIGEQWESPPVFTLAYNNTDEPATILSANLSDYVRKHMGIRLAKLSTLPTFVYNTWVPFYDNINEKLVLDLIDAAADCGIKEFIIDAGWFGSPEKGLSWTSVLGDYYVDKKKFPNGLKPIFDRIKEKGMKPGLWLSLASASQVSDVLHNHPEWFVRNEYGKIANLHNPSNRDLYTACMASGWYGYIRDKILNLVDEFGLAYVKLDLSIVTGAYVYNNDQSGCYAHGHGHHDRPESFMMMYEKAFELFDELHERAPELFIDCTFETAGKLQLIDYAIVKHAEGDWLSNFQDPQPFNALRVRNLAWNRAPVIPATALVIGNMRLEPLYHELVIASLTGSMPIVLGDLTKLSDADKKQIKKWSVWMQENQDRHNYLMFRQDVEGFGEPAVNNWDAFSRINTDTKSGGIVGVFRNASADSERKVRLHSLDKNADYQILKAPDNKVFEKMKGEDLMTKGFTVNILELNSFAIFEINKTE